MGLILSSAKYTIEHTDTRTQQSLCCCSLGLVDYILYNDPIIIIFKEKNIDSPRWLYYTGRILPLLGECYLGFPLNHEYLENNSQEFNSFVELTNHIKESSDSTELQTDSIAYQNINNNYLNQLA
jgi:hypothetical protein